MRSETHQGRKMSIRSLPLTLLLFSGCRSLVDVIPPKSQTIGAQVETAVRIGMYLEKDGKLPDSLASLPIREHYANRTSDGWGRPLIYQVDGDSFTLTSYGRDGKPGGEGDDADELVKYKVVGTSLEEVRPEVMHEHAVETD